MRLAIVRFEKCCGPVVSWTKELGDSILDKGHKKNMGAENFNSAAKFP